MGKFRTGERRMGERGTVKFRKENGRTGNERTRNMGREILEQENLEWDNGNERTGERGTLCFYNRNLKYNINNINGKITKIYFSKFIMYFYL